MVTNAPLSMVWDRCRRPNPMARATRSISPALRPYSCSPPPDRAGGVRVRIRPTGAERRGWRERIEVRKATLASIVRKSQPGVRLNEHLRSTRRGRHRTPRPYETGKCEYTASSHRNIAPDQNLIDAAAIQIDHFETPALAVEAFGDPRQTTELTENEADYRAGITHRPLRAKLPPQGAIARWLSRPRSSMKRMGIQSPTAVHAGRSPIKSGIAISMDVKDPAVARQRLVERLLPSVKYDEGDRATTAFRPHIAWPLSLEPDRVRLIKLTPRRPSAWRCNLGLERDRWHFRRGLVYCSSRIGFSRSEQRHVPVLQKNGLPLGPEFRGKRFRAARA